MSDQARPDREDLVVLVKVPGIGKKGAQRIVLELKDKIGAPSKTVTGRPLQTQEAWREQVAAGLVGLGYSARDAEDAVTATRTSLRLTPWLATGTLSSYPVEEGRRNRIQLPASVSRVGSAAPLARRTSACTRASSSANANGFVR